jgi:NAD+ synthase
MSSEVTRIAGHVIPAELQLDAAKTAATCEGFIRDYFEASGHATGIIGLSGGIDSALVAHLLVNALGRDRVRGVFMPSDTSAPSSLEDARLVARQLKITTEEISIAVPLQAVVAGLPDGEAITRVRQGNIAARLRMITLWDRSAVHQGLVVGTGNRTETMIGYWTMHGDGAWAINPIGALYKSQVRQLAAHLGVAEQVIAKAPSADLWPGQTDEGEGSFDYPTLDQVLYRLVDLRRTPQAIVAEGFDAATVTRIVELHTSSAFKRAERPIAQITQPPPRT